jgi:EAL domain-containing protein (putative c-di-GMP-specific phosphodiesterase class I)
VYGTIVSTVNQIGRIMGITTIAEEVESEIILQKVEVESEIILQKVRALGVEYAQGHAVAPPAPLVDAEGNVALPCVQRSVGVVARLGTEPRSAFPEGGSHAAR